MRPLAVVLASLAALVAGCGGTPDGAEPLPPPVPCSADTATATTSVSLAANQLLPFCVKVPPGAEVTFTNVDDGDHTATADASQPEQFDSGTLRPGQQFTHRFVTAAETVNVHCRLHPSASGRIVVVP